MKKMMLVVIFVAMSNAAWAIPPDAGTDPGAVTPVPTTTATTPSTPATNPAPTVNPNATCCKVLGCDNNTAAATPAKSCEDMAKELEKSAADLQSQIQSKTIDIQKLKGQAVRNRRELNARNAKIRALEAELDDAKVAMSDAMSRMELVKAELATSKVETAMAKEGNEAKVAIEKEKGQTSRHLADKTTELGMSSRKLGADALIPKITQPAQPVAPPKGPVSDLIRMRSGEKPNAAYVAPAVSTPSCPPSTYPDFIALTDVDDGEDAVSFRCVPYEAPAVNLTTLVTPDDVETPLYKNPVLWTVVGAVAAIGLGFGIAAAAGAFDHDTNRFYNEYPVH